MGSGAECGCDICRDAAGKVLVGAGASDLLGYLGLD